MNDKEEAPEEFGDKDVLTPTQEIIGQDKDSGDEKEIEIPPQFEEKVLAVIERSASFYSGPLPPPELLKDYDDIVPGCAEKIIGQFIAQGNHRRNLEKIVVEGDIKRANLGLGAGFTLGLVGLVGSLYVISLGYSGAGIVALASSLGPLVGSFIISVRERSKERKRKAKLVPEPSLVDRGDKSTK